MKEWALRRWKGLALIGLLTAGYAIAKLKPELQLERQFIEQVRHVVEAMQE
jgi:hypothetical protein